MRLLFTPQELAQKVLEQVTDNPVSLDMSNWETVRPCHTTRCVAGWAQFFVRGYVDIFSTTPNFVASDAQQLLGLSMEDRANLFTGSEDCEAIDALRYLAQGKAIDWDEIKKTHAESCDEC